MLLKSAQCIIFDHLITNHISITVFSIQNTDNMMQSSFIFSETITIESPYYLCVDKELFLFVTGNLKCLVSFPDIFKLNKSR